VCHVNYFIKLNNNFVKADVVFYYKLGIKGQTEYEDRYYSSINKDIWKG